MIVSVRQWFAARSRREKWLILVMLALFGVTIVWAVARPIDESLSNARRRNADAAIRLAQTRAAVAAVRSLRRARPDIVAGPIDAVVRQSATAAGLVLNGVAPDGAGLRAHIDSARGGVLLRWIAGLEAQGVLVDRADIRDAGNRTVAADISFRMTAP